MLFAMLLENVKITVSTAGSDFTNFYKELNKGRAAVESQTGSKAKA